MNRSRAGCLMISLVLLTWTTAAVVGRRVVCFGADGHVAWGAGAVDGSCASFPAAGGALPLPGNPHSAGADLSGTHCGPCNDVPAGSGKEWQTARTLSHPGSSSTAPTISPITFLGPASHGSAASTLWENGPLPVLRPALLSVRTTVLRI